MGDSGIHAAFASLEARLDAVQKTGNIELNIANSLWPQERYPFLDDYLALVEKHYRASITAVDYTGDLDAVCKKINSWVEEKTENKIKDLLPPGSLSPLSYLSLINAIYFKGVWENPFDKDMTKPFPFWLTSDRQVYKPMMVEKDKAFKYSGFDVWFEQAHRQSLLQGPKG